MILTTMECMGLMLECMGLMLECMGLMLVNPDSRFGQIRTICLEKKSSSKSSLRA